MLRAAILIVALGCGACVCSRDHAGSGAGFDPKPVVATFALDVARAKADMAELTRAPHAFGSPRQGEVLSWLEARIKEGGLLPLRQPFTVPVPNPAAGAGPAALTLDRSGANVYAAGALSDDPPCVVALATHVDTKDLAFTPYLGANDSGSSTVALLQQLAFLKGARAGPTKFECDVIGIFFDGEEAVLPNWSDGLLRHPAKIQDNTYGSRFAAAQLTACTYAGKPAHCLPAGLGAPVGGKPLVGLVLMDMIGSPGVRISRDSNSTPQLQALAADGARGLGRPELYDPTATRVEDDHMPFSEARIPNIDLIDFNHRDFWHRQGDDPDQISYESVDLSARLGLWVSLSVAHDPQVFPSPAE